MSKWFQIEQIDHVLGTDEIGRARRDNPNGDFQDLRRDTKEQSEIRKTLLGVKVMCARIPMYTAMFSTPDDLLMEAAHQVVNVDGTNYLGSVRDGMMYGKAYSNFLLMFPSEKGIQYTMNLHKSLSNLLFWLAMADEEVGA